MTFSIYSLGCKVNIYESEYVCDLMLKNGFTLKNFDEECDIYIINTCSVTNESDKKSRKIINKAKRTNPSAIILVMGCYSQSSYNEIDADIIIGNKDKSQVVNLINEYIENKEKIVRIYDLKKQEFESMEITNFKNHTRAFVKIQDGCNNFCTYCIIPYVRGDIRSKKEIEVINEVTSLVNNGYKEIVLTGIHTGKYGRDINSSLEHLLKELVKIPNIYRIRLSSIEINEITDGIIDLIKDNKIMAKHLHIPLQSGSDKILSLMGRRYDLNFFKKKIKEIRDNIPDISITTDLILGFPGENEEDYQETLNTLNEIKFTKIHTFPYSIRKGTKAALMDNQIKEEIKKQRVKEVIKLSNFYEEVFYNSYIGKTVEVLTEEKDNYTLSHSSNYLPIIINKKIDNNKIINVKINSLEDNKLIGSVINDKQFL